MPEEVWLRRKTYVAIAIKVAKHALLEVMVLMARFRANRANPQLLAILAARVAVVPRG